MGLTEADADGFTETPANAWFTREARARRAASRRTWGPWGVFVAPAPTSRGRRAATLLEVCLTISILSGGAAFFLFPRLSFFAAVGLAVWAGRVAFAQVPLLEHLDEEEFLGLEGVT